MLYAVLKTVHLLSLLAWVGGMFFMLACLRPALGVLEGPARLRLMRAVMGRFFAVVSVAIALILLSGLWMLGIVRGLRGSLEGLPAAWYVMFALGVVMMAVFEYLRGAVFKRMKTALDGQDAPAAAKALARVRGLVSFNLALGVVIFVAMKVGAAV